MVSDSLEVTALKPFYSNKYHLETRSTSMLHIQISHCFAWSWLFSVSYDTTNSALVFTPWQQCFFSVFRIAKSFPSLPILPLWNAFFMYVFVLTKLHDNVHLQIC